MNENTQSLPAASPSQQSFTLSKQEKIDAYAKLTQEAMQNHFASPELDGNIPPGFDLQEYCGYDSAIAASRESISREKAARIEGFMAGVAAERERCAKIADSFDCYESPEIARLIRSGE